MFQEKALIHKEALGCSHTTEPEFDEKGDPMKKTVPIILFCLILSALCAGCGKQAAQHAQPSQAVAIANPWSDWDSIGEAEAAVGSSFGLPEVIAGSYTAVTIRTLSGELIEVVYRDEAYEVCVRKKAGEGQDISGDYNKYDTCTEQSCNGAAVTTYHNAENNAVKQLVSYNGYSWSLVAPNGYWGDSNREFISEILG